MDELSDEYRSFTTFIKNNLTNFFVEKTKQCDGFFSKLKEDDFERTLKKYALYKYMNEQGMLEEMPIPWPDFCWN
jgi:hypothetical protein